MEQELYISIHAPTQGATWTAGASKTGGADFNPRTHAGCDPGQLELPKRAEPISIHAPTQGATVKYRIFPIIVRYFNPRTHAGCDSKIEQKYVHYLRLLFNFCPIIIKLHHNPLYIFFSSEDFNYIHGAKALTNSCSLSVRTKLLVYPQRHRTPLHLYDRLYFCNSFPDNKTASYLHLYQ